jgi:teichuronic acid biosynthesis glycosyltransferase TuaG
MTLPRRKLISVIIPFHNELSLIDRAVSSVVMQDYQDIDFEILIVNDGPIHNTDVFNAIKCCDNIKLDVVKNNQEKGPGGARNCGLNIATGHYVAFLDADDMWMKNKIREQIKILNDGATFVCSGYDFAGGGLVVVPPANIHKPLDIFTQRGIGTSSVVISKKTIGNTRFKNFRFAQDIDFWYRVASQHCFVYGSSDKVLVTYNPFGSTKSKCSQLIAMVRVLRENQISFGIAMKILVSYGVTGIYRHYLSLGRKQSNRGEGPQNE